jgi:hypothetical protein
VGCGAGHPITYQRDITLIGGLSMVAALTGRLGDGAPVRVTYPASVRSSSRIRCAHALMSARCEKAWGKFPGCQPVYGSISWAYGSSGLA